MAELLTLARMARRVGVTQEWLKAQADAGNVPCLRTGKRRYLFAVEAVQEALATMAAKTRQGGESDE